MEEPGPSHRPTNKEANKEEFESLNTFEKVELFNNLISYGSHHNKYVQSINTIKSKRSIEKYLQSRKLLAMKRAFKEDRIMPKSMKYLYNIMCRLVPFNDSFEVSRALKYIALFDKKIKHNEYLRNCFEVLSDCLRGEAPKHLSPVNSMLLLKSLEDLFYCFNIKDSTQDQMFLKRFVDEQLQQKNYDRRKDIDATNCTSSNPLSVPDFLLTYDLQFIKKENNDICEEKIISDEEMVSEDDIPYENYEYLDEEFQENVC